MKSDKMQWLVLVTVMVGTFLGRIDQTIVNLALPKMIDAFSVTVSAASWIGTLYILANAVFVPIWGKLGDTIGRKKVYIMGFVIFIFGSVLAGFAWNLSSMLVFRVIQAIASSADYPTAMAILAVTFTDAKKRAQALGIWSASFAAASVFGPLIGGPLIDNFGWRSVFLINLPVGLIGIAMALAFVHESVSERKTVRFDWWGAITLGGVLASIMLVLDKGLEWGWTSGNSLMMYALILICGAAFYFIETTHEEPMIDFKFFTNSTFTHTLINNFMVFMGLLGSVFLIPLFAHTFLGLNATQTGYLFIPMAAMFMLSAPLGGKLIGKVEPRYIIAISTAIAATGMMIFSYLDPRSTVWDIILPLSLMAFGMGFGMSQRTVIISNSVPHHEVGVASSILALARNIGGAFGIAIFGTILQYSTENKVIAISEWSSVHAHSSADMQQAISLISLKAQIAAYGTVYLSAAALMFAAAILALWIRIKKEDVDTKTEIFVE